MRRLGVLAVVAAIALAACGEDGPPAMAPEDLGAQHIHGLGINPADGSLMIATHTGLFRAAPDEHRAERVGDKHQDTMGFTVVAPDRFLGSGHPDARDALPPLLGLIRSDDAGRSWQPVSLLGEADFHTLRAAGRRIYGFDATSARLLVSADAGRSWRERTPPAAVIDLAVDPADAEHVVASTESGLFSSRDAGQTWRPLSRNWAGLLAWTPEALVLIDGAGVVHRSGDGGRRFAKTGDVRGQPAALTVHGTELYVALHTNEVKTSQDLGSNWALRLSVPNGDVADARGQLSQAASSSSASALT